MKRQVDHRGRVSINLRIPTELAEELEAAADERAVGRSWLAERLIAEGLRRLIPVEELTLTRPAAEPEPPLPACATCGSRAEVCDCPGARPYRIRDPRESDDDEAGQGDGPGDQAGGDPVGRDPGEAEEAGDEHRDDGSDGDDPDDEARLPGDDVGPAAGGSGHAPSIPVRVVCEAHGIEGCPACLTGGAWRATGGGPVHTHRPSFDVQEARLPPADPHAYRRGGWADGAVRPDWG